MAVSKLVISGIAWLSFIFPIEADEEKCPELMPLKIHGYCFRFQTDPLRYQDASDNCPKMDPRARMANIKDKKILREIEEFAYEFLYSKVEKAIFWIGLYMDDRSMSKAAEDRYWKWFYDDTKIVQKDYNLWDSTGGPKDKGLTCASLNASNNFLVQPVDCGGPRIPVICMMQEGEKCQHSVAPYLMYGDYCVAAINGAFDYQKMLSACGQYAPTPYTDENKEAVILAAKNSFLGGGIFMNMKRFGDRFIDMSDGSEPDPEWWEEGEPREEYDCVGLSFQPDNSMKLKTINCDFLSASLCVMGGQGDSTIDLWPRLMT